jgi:hypothetical protein
MALHTSLVYLDALQLQLAQGQGEGQLQPVPQGHSQVVIIGFSFYPACTCRNNTADG